MSEISKSQLKTEIDAILKDADLQVITEKKVRCQLEKKFDCSLISRKNDIKELVMDFINGKEKESSESEIESEEEEKTNDDKDSDNEPALERRSRKRAAAPARKAAPKKKVTENGEKKASGRKGTGFTRPLPLSPQLASIMGADSLPRHEVVKKIWAIIKERNLYDPKNKQFAICDPELHKVMGVKRFRTFGMLKYLKQHFITED